MLNEISREQLARNFEGISTPEENREIIRWYKNNPENERLLSELKEVWILTGRIPEDFKPNMGAAWEKVSNKIDDYENATISTSKNILWYFSRVAVVFVLGFVLYFMYQLNNTSQLSFENISTVDSKKEILLPDGSKVWLNKNTELEYIKDFEGDTRLVKLKGEAFFEVTRNPEKPFIIESEYSQVKVLGTSFNYKAYSIQKENTLVVNSGKVEFSDIDNINRLVLEKGEKVLFNIDENSMKKMENDNKNYLAWKTGVLVFENETFENIIKDISKYYSKRFEFTNTEQKSTRLTVTFDNQKFEDVIKILELTMDITFQNNSVNILIN